MKPDMTHAHWRLGIAWELQDNIPAALEAYRQASIFRPTIAEAAVARGRLLEAEGHRHEAIGCFRQAASAAPRSSVGRLAETRALIAERRDQEAERDLRRILALEPKLAEAHEMLAQLLANAGNFREAISCYQAALGLAPDRVGLWYDIARCRKITPADRPTLAIMQRAAARTDVPAEQRILSHLALGKAHEDLHEYGPAMRQYDLADGVRRLVCPFNAAQHLSRVEALIAQFPASKFSARNGCADPTPILIVGMPRSGTTLVEQIISSHPRVTGGGEMHFWGRRGAMWEASGPHGADDEFLRRAGSEYLEWLRRSAPEAERVTDKMPFNFLWLGLINLALPNARIIHCRRSPLDTGLSIHSTFFSPKLPFPTGGPDLVRYYEAYARLMAHWRSVLPNDRFLDVRYEDLIASPEAVSRSLIAFCGMEWHDDCLRPEANTRLVKTASKWQVRQPINAGSIRRWARFEPWLGDIAELAAMTGT